MRELVKLQNITVEIAEFTVFEDVKASVLEGEIIGVIGKNGAGKSTLLKLIHNDIAPMKGYVQWIEPNLKMVFVEQEQESYMFEEGTHLEQSLRKKWNVPTSHFSQLSGGEKLKARLSKGFAQGADLLLLDEPTNHLDEQSTVLLIEEIKSFKGTMILVSHDRYFLDKVATKIWSIEDRKVIEHLGNYSSYLEARKKKRLSQQREYGKQQKMIERIEG